MPLTDKDGNVITFDFSDPGKFSDQLEAALAPVVSEGVKPVQDKLDEIAGSIPTAESLTEQVGEAVKTAVADIKPKGDPDKPKASSDVADAIKDALAPISERLEALTSERERERLTATARELAQAAVTAKAPNAPNKDRLIQRVLAGTPKDAAAAEQLLGEVLDDYKQANVDMSTWQAGSKEAEGGKADDGDSGDDKKKEEEHVLRIQRDAKARAGLQPASA